MAPGPPPCPVADRLLAPSARLYVAFRVLYIVGINASIHLLRHRIGGQCGSEDLFVRPRISRQSLESSLECLGLQRHVTSTCAMRRYLFASFTPFPSFPLPSSTVSAAYLRVCRATCAHGSCTAGLSRNVYVCYENACAILRVTFRWHRWEPVQFL